LHIDRNDRREENGPKQHRGADPSANASRRIDTTIAIVITPHAAQRHGAGAA